MNSSSYAPFIYVCLIALAPQKGNVTVSCQREKFFRVKPPFPKSLIRWIENFCPCGLVYECMRLVVLHTICPLVRDSFWSLFICLFFSRGLVTRKIPMEQFIHRIDYVTANSEGLITQESVIKVRSFNREHRKSSVDFMKSILLHKENF